MAAPPLGDALASFSRATHEAFVAVEAEVRRAVAQAQAETREARHERDEARRERDEAVHARHDYQLEVQILKQEVGEYKAALKQADTTIAHQEETIAQARREAAQWKDQSRNWQDHFLRVEQERCKLSSRVDELVSERLLHSQAHSAPFTPRRTYADLVDPAFSTSSTKRASSSHRSRLDSSPDPKTSSDVAAARDTSLRNSKVASKARRSPPSNSPARHPHQPTPEITPSRRRQLTSPTVSRSQTQLRKQHQQPAVQPQAPILPTTRMSDPQVPLEPRQVFLRRVQAVVEIPIKEEDAEDENLLDSSGLSASTSTSGSLSTSVSGPGSISMDASRGVAVHRNKIHDARRFAPTKPRAARRRGIVRSDDDSGLDDDDYDDVEEPNSNSAALIVNDHSDEEDDELMMGAEDNRREVYGTKPIDDRARNGLAGPTGQKRKVGAPVRNQQSKKSRH